MERRLRMNPQHSFPQGHPLSWFAPNCSKLSTNYLLMHAFTPSLQTFGHSYSHQVMDHHSGVLTKVGEPPGIRKRSKFCSQTCKRPPGNNPWVNLTNYSIKTKNRPFTNLSSWADPKTWRSLERAQYKEIKICH